MARGLKKGQTNNKKGRPKVSLAEELRANPKVVKVIDKVISVASTLNTAKEHPQAMTCAKVLMDKSIPTLKAQEIDLQGGLEVAMPTIIIKGKNDK